jgi:hypothetical protein
MQQKKIKTIIIIGSLILFVISLTQVGITVDQQGYPIIPEPGVSYSKDNAVAEEFPSLNMFLMGSTAIIGGGALEWLIWFANPLSLLTIFLLFNNNSFSRLTSIAALILALSFSFWKKILANEGGGMTDILSFELGYKLWCGSILFLTIGVFYYFRELPLKK